MYQPILSVQEYYARLNEYILQVGLPDDIEGLKNWDEERGILRAAMGEADGRSVLDCSCGWGRQAIALAKSGWQVTATDVAGSSMDFARQCAREEEVPIDFRVCDMRDLAQHFRETFDWVISCYALYEILDDENIQRAVDGMYAALKRGGHCYVRLRDMEFLMEERPRYWFEGEKRVPNGRVICISDWDFESETHVIHIDAFLREDERYQDYRRWRMETPGYRKRLLGEAELEQFLHAAGFRQIAFLPREGPWCEHEVVASKQGGEQ